MVYSDGVETFWLFFGVSKEEGTKVFDTEDAAREYARGKVGRVDGPYLTSGGAIKYHRSED